MDRLTLRGRVAATRFSTVLEGLALPFGLTIDSLELHGAGIEVDPEPFAIRTREPAAFEAHIGPASLAAFLERENPGGLYDFDVQARDERLHVQANLRMLVEMRVAVVCALEIEAGTRLIVRAEDVDVMGIGARGLVQGQLEKLNPLFDASQLPFGLRFESVEIIDRILLRGTAQP